MHYELCIMNCALCIMNYELLIVNDENLSFGIGKCELFIINRDKNRLLLHFLNRIF